MIGLLYIAAIFVTFILVATLIYQARLFRHRGVSRDAFIGEFRGRQVPDAIPGVVYDYYKESALWKRFGVSPGDRYEDLFSAEPDDISDDARELVRRLGMHMPIEAVLREWQTPIRTLADIVEWLNWVLERQQDQEP
jgi:hypothetical protein